MHMHSYSFLSRAACRISRLTCRRPTDKRRASTSSTLSMLHGLPPPSLLLRCAQLGIATLSFCARFRGAASSFAMLAKYEWKVCSSSLHIVAHFMVAESDSDPTSHTRSFCVPQEPNGYEAVSTHAHAGTAPRVGPAPGHLMGPQS